MSSKPSVKDHRVMTSKDNLSATSKDRLSIGTAAGLLVALILVALVFVSACNRDATPPSKPVARSEGKPVKKPVKPTEVKTTADTNHGDSTSHKGTPNKGKKNRLSKETSPYLLMHQYNPVDWYPWCEEALAKAKKENKLIFLSIGYSSCHWCHVMERESFMDEEIAAYLNANFVCIKIDREERPDIDAIFMTAVQLLNNGHGGWPMSVFLTPEGLPFWGGTYFPARDGDRGVTSGFLTIAQKLVGVWKTESTQVTQTADRLAVAIKEQMQGLSGTQSVAIEDELVKQVQRHLADQYDEAHGGFGYTPMDPGRPKFPEPSILFFLLQRSAEGDVSAREMLVGTLDNMAQGGIRDHLGGGFHRYSTDRFWHIPHFEKMLYDNGQLASVYAAAFELTGDDGYRHAVTELLGFVQREMRSPDGAFYSALDADSDGEEGKFYRWQKDEISDALSDEQLTAFNTIYGLDGVPNFEEEYYVPQMVAPLARLAEDRMQGEAELRQLLSVAKTKLLALRSERNRPLTDTKILTSWNGLMIRGFADAGRILDEPRYTRSAVEAGEFIWKNLRAADGHLLHTYSQGKATLNAYLDDYSFLANGFLAIYRATDEKIWLDRARQLTDEQIVRYWDEADGGFFFTSGDHEALLARSKNPFDGARPSGNSVAAENLLVLADAFPDAFPGLDYRDRAEKTIASSLAALGGRVENCPRLATVIATYLQGSTVKPTQIQTDAKEATSEQPQTSDSPSEESGDQPADDPLPEDTTTNQPQPDSPERT